MLSFILALLFSGLYMASLGCVKLENEKLIARGEEPLNVVSLYLVSPLIWVLVLSYNYLKHGVLLVFDKEYFEETLIEELLEEETQIEEED